MMTSRVLLTKKAIAAFQCPQGRSQSFLWDSRARHLALRVSAQGKKSFVFESRLVGQTIRMSLGTADALALEQARERSRAYQRLVDQKLDPRDPGSWPADIQEAMLGLNGAQIA